MRVNPAHVRHPAFIPPALTTATTIATNATMPSPDSSLPALPPCPHLPPPRADMDWRALNAVRTTKDQGFYLTALTYGHTLWQRTLPARALLCLDRAMSADLRGDEPVLQTWPLPYAAMAWFMAHTPRSVFIGNPRVHFQHYADRLGEPRRDQRKWRAWACWALARRLRPEWPADPRHVVAEPSEAAIADRLDRHGLPGETALWQSVLQTCAPRDPGD